MYIRYAAGDMTETQAHVEGGHVECPIVSCENVRGESRAVAISRQSLHDCNWMITHPMMLPRCGTLFTSSANQVIHIFR